MSSLGWRTRARRAVVAALLLGPVLAIASVVPAPAPASADVGAPSWWNGDCDSVHWNAAAKAKGWNGAGAHRLGASYLGVPVCGPRHSGDGAPDVLWTRAGWGHYEWECPELAFRFMAQIYGVAAYQANGNQVVAHYTTAKGGGLVKVTNGTVGKAPQPGDVLSFDHSTNGHVAVVAASTVDGSGNGTIRLLSQNDTADGWRALTVTAWRVAGFGTYVPTAWLHDPLGRGLTASTAPYRPFASWDAFVARQRTDLAGGPGTVADRAPVVADLAAGTLTPAAAIAQLLHGPWFGGHAEPVARLYWAYFGRIPDQGGLAYWTDRNRTGTRLDPISQAFAASNEFKATYGALTDADFATLVYRNVLGRVPDAGGLAYWVGQLQGGRSRGAVMTGFSESNEYRTAMAVRIDVVLAYSGLLHRVPTAIELVMGAAEPLTTLIDDLRVGDEYTA